VAIEISSISVSLPEASATSVATEPAQRSQEQQKDPDRAPPPNELGPGASVLGFSLPAVSQTGVNTVNPVNPNLPSTLSVVDAAQRRGNGPPGNPADTEEEETQSTKAARLFSSTLDGDDSISQIEMLLEKGSLPPPAGAPTATTRAEAASATPPKGSAEAPASASRIPLLAWLLVPAGIMALGLGFWRRFRWHRNGRGARSAPLGEAVCSLPGDVNPAGSKQET
jgi:hypothetical protein